MQQQNWPQNATIINISQLSEEQVEQNITEQLQQKQNYLKAQIYDQYHESEEVMNAFTAYFKKYLQDNKGAVAIQLNYVSIKQLENIISNFRQQILTNIIRKPSESNEREWKKGTNRVSCIISDEINLKKCIYNNQAWDYEIEAIQNCHKQKKIFKPIKAANLTIQFDKYFIKSSGGFFGIGCKKELFIQMSAQFLQEKVQRNLEDFIFLEQVLHRIYPHSFIPPLRFSSEDIRNIKIKEIKKQIIQKCFIFINKLCSYELLRQNPFTWKFLTLLDEKKYKDHKRNNQEISVNCIEQYKNLTGIVKINVSQKGEQMKINYGDQSLSFQKRWADISRCNSQMRVKSKQLSDLIKNQMSSLQSIKEQVRKNKDNPPSQIFSNLLTSYQNIMNSYHNVIDKSQNITNYVDDNFVRNTAQQWQQFRIYEQSIVKKSKEYQTRRKQFLQGQALKLQIIPVENNIKPDLKIQFLNLESNNEELLWIQNETIWYGYMSQQYLNTFQQFFSKDIQLFRQIMMKATHEMMQNNQKQQKHLYTYLSSLCFDI